MHLALIGIQLCGLAVWLPLEFMVITALLRGEYRRFPFLFIYSIAEFLAVASEIPTLLAQISHSADKSFVRQKVEVFSLNEVILQILIYAVVLSLIYKATAPLKWRGTVRAYLIGGAVLLAGISFLIHYSPAGAPGLWLTPWTRDLNFLSAILDLSLWVRLIAARNKDGRLLLLSGALGIRFTGEAMGDSLRQLAIAHRTRPLSLAGATLVTASDLLCLYIWWRAFRGVNKESAGRSAAHVRIPEA